MKESAKQPLELLVLAAHAMELKPFLALGRKYVAIKKDVAFLAAGVGPVAAAFGLTHFLEDFRPKRIALIGTAGVINVRKFAIGDVVRVSRASSESGFSQCYAPKIQKRRVAFATHGIKGMRIKNAATYCPQEITRDEAWRDNLAKRGHDVENLEAFALGFVARKFKIPITAFVGLTNLVGPNAHGEWIKNNDSMILKTHQVLLEKFPKLATL